MAKTNSRPRSSSRKSAKKKQTSLVNRLALRRPLSFGMMAAVVLAVAVAGYAIVRSSQAATCTISANLVNSCRPWLGAFAIDYPGYSSLTGLPQVQGEEDRTGQHLDIVHTDYHVWTEDSLTPEEISIANETNQYAWVNWKPAPNWSDGDGGDAAVNANIKHMADSIKNNVPSSHKLFITPWHEPNNDVSSGPVSGCTAKGNAGTPAQYIAMWQNVENIFNNDGVHNVVWGLLYQAYAPLECWDQALYPGNNLVDWIGFDSYGNGGSSNAFQNSVGAGYNYFVKLGNEAGTSTAGWMSKPVVVGEWGSCRAAYSSQTNANYFADAKYSLDHNLYPDIKAYMIFDAPGTGFTNPAGNHYPGGCQLGYQEDGKATDSVQQAAYNKFADDPIFSSSKVTETPTPTPTPTPKPTPTPTPKPTPTPTPVTSSSATVVPSSDAYVYNQEPNTNFGDVDPLFATSTQYRALLRLHTAGVIPAGNHATSAKLMLFVRSELVSSGGFEIHPEATSGWTAATVTWNNQPAWNATVLATSATPKAGKWLTINLPLSAVNLKSETDFGIRFTVANSGASFASRENTNLPPQLVVTYASN